MGSRLIWLGAVVAIAALMALPGALGTSMGSASPPATGPHDLAGDPSGFPPANYSNPSITPPPAVPDTTPKVVTLAAYGNVTIPKGVWETVIMNYTGYTAGTAYDYFQTVTIDGAMVYVGVNPEAGSWTQLVNLSAYLAFFDRHTSITISGPHLGPGTNFEGVQINNLSLAFYPIPKGWAGPSYPNVVEPLFAFSGTPSSAAISVPANASAVVLQLMAIGSEFWYSLNPDFTAVTVSAGAYNLSTYLQYPWINSGGIDLFAWRPIYPVNMLDHQWESFNLTGALGILEHESALNVSAATGAMGASVIANLLVYTSPDVKGAVQTSYGYDQRPVVTYTQSNASVVNPNGNNYTVYDQFDRIGYGYSSRVATRTGHYSVALATSERYANLQSLNDVWQNISESETVATTQTTTYDERNLVGTVVTDQYLSYPLAMQIGEILTYLYTQGSDSYYNYTSYLYNVTQGYLELDTSGADLNGQRSVSVQYTDDAIYGTNGVFDSLLEFGPGFAIILNITYSYHTTHKVDTQITYDRGPNGGSYTFYQHRLSGVENNSSSYYVEETLTQDRTVSFSYTWAYGRGRNR
jgi:hypothetical protein